MPEVEVRFAENEAAGNITEWMLVFEFGSHCVQLASVVGQKR